MKLYNNIFLFACGILIMSFSHKMLDAVLSDYILFFVLWGGYCFTRK